MYKCEVCNREIFKKHLCDGKCVCTKHMHQFRKYGRFLDNISRTNNDLNDYVIEETIAKFNVYNQKNIYVASFIIDKEDIEKVKYHKWRIDNNNHIITGNCTKSHPRKELSRLILECNDESKVVDHINGNTLDNRKCNLRICTQAQNTYNKSKVSNNKSGIIGVGYNNSRHTWDPEIRWNNKRVHLGRYKKIEEAAYVRYIAENIVFKEYRNKNLDNEKLELFSKIPQQRKKDLENYTIEKIHNKSKSV